jgi:hypothetical protein
MRARDLFMSVRELFVCSRDHDMARIGLFRVRRGVHH